MPRVAQRRVGRPRADPRPLRGDPREEILRVAARLFSRQGFAGTSTRQIAQAAGLRQPSLFHYFPRKHALLGALLDRSVDATEAYAASVEADGGSPALRFYRLYRFDVFQLSRRDYDIGSIARLPEARQPAFAGFWRRYRRLVARYEALIAEGVASGDFAPCDPALAARALVGMEESVPAWHPRRDGPEPVTLAEQVADLALRSLLSRPSALARIRASAGPLDA